MNTNQAGLGLIKAFEGFSGAPYICPAGIPTIGYGSTWDMNGDSVTMEHTPITEAEAETLMMHELAVVENQVERLVTIPLTDNQFSALVSFTYNLGSGNLQASTLLRKINRGDETDSEFGRWIYAGGRKLPGLIRRREVERLLFLAA